MSFDSPIVIVTGETAPGNPSFGSPLYRWSTADLEVEAPRGLPAPISDGLYIEDDPNYPDTPGWAYPRSHFQFLRWVAPGDGLATMEVHAFWGDPFGYGSAGLIAQVYSLGVDGPYTAVSIETISPNNGVEKEETFRVVAGRVYYFMISTHQRGYLALPEGSEPHDQEYGISLSYLPDGPAPVDYGNETDGFSPFAGWPASDAPSVPGNRLPDGSGSATILELVREFSSKVRRAVHIVNSKTIRMVDPNDAMPGGLRQADADNMYYTSTQNLTAKENVLRVRTGRLELEGSAGVVTNDIRIVTSGWKIPGRLPVYGIDPSPVKRVSMTFTPTEFTASVDFHLPDPPISVRRPL